MIGTLNNREPLSSIIFFDTLFKQAGKVNYGMLESRRHDIYHSEKIKINE